MSAARIAIVVAAARNGVIGRAGGMPWRLPTDLRHFKALTLGKPVIMGRRTWQSIGRPLPGRPNIVVTREASLSLEGAETVLSLEQAILRGAEKAAELGVDEMCVIGGGQLYSQAIGRADIIHLTVVEAEIEGDTLFPEIDARLFEKIAETAPPRGETDSHSVTFTTWRRRSA